MQAWKKEEKASKPSTAPAFTEDTQRRKCSASSIENEITELVKAYKGCLFFAVMREDKFLGEEMGECPVVLKIYPKQSVKQALGPYMWHTIYSSLHQHLHGKCFFSVQLAGRNKIRVGIKDTSTMHVWLTQVKYELETLGRESRSRTSWMDPTLMGHPPSVQQHPWSRGDQGQSKRTTLYFTTYCHGSKSRTSYPCSLPREGLCTRHVGSRGVQEISACRPGN